MVESEAKELPEDVMLKAVMEGHRSFQPVIEAIIQIAEHAAKDPMPLGEPSEASKSVAATLKATIARQDGRGLHRDREAGPPGQDQRGEGRGQEAVRGQGRGARGLRRAVRQPRGGRGAQRGPRHRQAYRRPRHQDGPSDRGRGRHPAARPRLVAVHPRRDPGAGRGHARHRPGRADHRRARGRVPRSAS